MAKAKQKPQNTPKLKNLDLPNWSFLVLFALTTLIMFWQQIFGNAFFWEDFVEYVYPVQSFAASEFAKGIIPFWNPYSFNGMPFLADMQVGFFYPLNRILSLFVNDGVLSVQALQLMIIFHFFISQVSMFFLAKQYKISSYGAALSAVSFAFSFLLVLHVIHPMIVYMLAWFPLVLMFFLKAIDNKDISAGIIAGLILGISMLAGHPQMTLYELFFMVLLLIWKVFFDLKNAGSNKLNMIIAGVVPFIIAAGIFQIQYLPTSELADLSQRAEMTYEASSEGSMEFKQVITAFVPKFFGEVLPDNNTNIPFYLNNDGNQSPYFYYWETGFYFGIVALILGLFAAFVRIKDKKILFLVIIAIFGLLYSLGDNFILHKIFYNFPLFGGFRNPARMMIFVIIAFSLLSGFGIDLVLKANKDHYKSFIIAAAIPFVIGLAISAGLFTSSHLDPSLTSKVNSQGISPIIISLLVLVLGFFTFNKKIHRITFTSIIVLIAFFDLISHGNNFNQSNVDPADKYKIDNKTLEAFSPSSPNDLFRVNTRMYNPSYMAMNRNIGLVKRIMLVEGYNPLVLQKVTPPVKDAETVHDVLNVKYEIGLDPQTRQPVFKLNEDMFPRAWIVHDFEVFDNEDILKKSVSSGEFDLKHKAALLSEPSFDAIKNKFSPIPEILEFSSNSITIETNADTDGILCLSEIYYPAWKAFSNGKELEVLNANYSLRAVMIKKGKQTIEFKYQSSAFIVGMWLSIITVLLALMGLIILRKINHHQAM